MVKLMGDKMKEKAGDEKAQAAEQILAKLKERMKQKEVEIQDKIKNSVYTIGDAVVEGDVAKVPVSYVYQAQTKNDTLELKKKDGVWLMSSLGNSFTMAGGPGTGAP